MSSSSLPRTNMEHFNRTFKEKPGATLLSVIYSSELCAHIKAKKQCFLHSHMSYFLFSLEQETLILILICTKPAPCLPYMKPNHIYTHTQSRVRQPGWQAPRRKTRQVITGSCNISDFAVRQTDAVCIQAASEGWRTRPWGLIDQV